MPADPANSPPRARNRVKSCAKDAGGMRTADAPSGAQDAKESGAEPLANSRHERFACELAKGSAAGKAYEAAGYKRDDGCASRLLRNAKVAARVDWLKRQAAAVDVLTIAEKRQFLARLVRCKPAVEPHDSDLWNGVEAVDGVIKYKLPDKLRAIALDNDLAGEGAEASGQKALAELVKRLRK